MEQREPEWLSDFEAVWQRVMTGQSCTLPVSGERDSEQVMEAVHWAWSGYRQLARCSRGRLQCSLQEMTREAKEVFRALQTEYFLRTGELYHPPESEKFASCTLSNLRKLWKNAFESGEKLHGIQGNDKGACSEALAAAAELFDSHRDRLRCMIGQLME